MALLLLLYVLLLFYGSWYPFSWGQPAEPLFFFLHQPLPAHWDKGDIVQNMLVYMPFGLLMVAWCDGGLRSVHFPTAVVLAAACGTAISLIVEYGQQYLPARVPSLPDVAMNCAGSMAGALLGALLSRHTGAGATFLTMRDAWFRPGALANAGLAAIGLWFLSQTSPLVPSLDLAALRHSLGYLYRSVSALLNADLGKLATLLCCQTGLGILLATLLAAGRPLLRTWCLLLAFVCGFKLLVAGRVLSAELLVAAALTVPLLALLRTLPPRALATCGIVALAAGLVVYELQPGKQAAALSGFNWMPFAGQMENLSGLENILEFLWPTMAMACLLRQVLPFHRQDAGAVAGMVVVTACMFLLEWLQQSVPGRHGDITQVVLACAGWIVPWCVPPGSAKPGRRPASRRWEDAP